LGRGAGAVKSGFGKGTSAVRSGFGRGAGAVKSGFGRGTSAIKGLFSKSSNDNSSSEDSEEKNYTKMKVAELKAELKNKGLSTSGKKAELIKRLEN
ncbi:SAP domain-containing protein, partial [Marine Group III euryarchaeote]|nr:SAP domain-containing protein [Marine Group III euryarchaeote]